MLSRVFDVTQPADSPDGQRRLWELAALHLPKGSSADYNQALMDIGSAVCIPANPRCPICPVRSLCKARKLGVQSQRPVMKAKKAVPHHVFGAAVIVRRGRVLLSQRPSKGLLGGMWEFPNGKIRPNSCKQLPEALRRDYRLEIQCGERLGIIEHGYSHFTVSVHAFRCTALSIPKSKNLRWIPLTQLRNFPMGRIDRQIAGKLLMMDDLSGERHRMVESQLQARGLRDPRLLAAFEQVPRHLFVPPQVRHDAYEDIPLPIGYAQSISQPYIVALMASLLELDGDERVLEIGTGSGYEAAILSRLGC